MSTVSQIGDKQLVEQIINKTITQFTDQLCTEIGAYSFTGCEALQSVYTLSVASIGESAFLGCTELQVVDCAVLQQVGTDAFKDCTQLQSLVIRSDSVCFLGTNAFRGTPIEDGLGKIYVKKTLVENYKKDTRWSDYAGQICAIEDYPDECSRLMKALFDKPELGDFTSSVVIGDKVYLSRSSGGVGLLSNDADIIQIPEFSQYRAEFGMQTDSMYILFLSASYNYRTAISTDGLNWTVSSLPISNNSFAFALFKGKILLAGKSINYSTDGLNWTQSNAPNNTFRKFFVFEDVVFSQDNNTHELYCSTDGVTWVKTNLPAVNYTEVYRFKGTYYVLNSYYAAEYMYVSSDGEAWTQDSKRMAKASVMFDDLWVISTGDNVVYTEDGKKWTSTKYQNSHDFYYFNGVYYIATNTNVQYSLDLRTWDILTTRFSGRPSFWPVGDSLLIYHSSSNVFYLTDDGVNIRAVDSYCGSPQTKTAGSLVFNLSENYYSIP